MKNFETIRTPLTQLPFGYDKSPQTINVHPFSPDIHYKPGLYLEHQEGCGYTVFSLTPNEARDVAKALIDAANWVDKQKWGNPKYG